MAYEPKNLSALAYANGFTLWHYKTPDVSQDVDTTGYFNGAASMLRIGDFILANASTGGTIESGAFVVRAIAGGVVDVANISDFGGGNPE